MNTYEKVHWDNNELVCGIDEVGRGCIAGPLVVCGVILPIDFHNDVINDSKTLSEKKRNELFDVIIENAVSIHLEVVNEKTVDVENIYQATKNAMESTVSYMSANYYLIDAMPLNTTKAHRSLIKGDTLSISIAAASIIAKVVRDQIMVHFDDVYPEYGFKNHKGYPTKMHKDMLLEHGILDIHRKSYKPVSDLLEHNK